MTGRTDEWRWYCRIDGAEGAYPTPEERDAAALKHRDKECETRDLAHPEWAEAGHLVHVWRWGKPVTEPLDPAPDPDACDCFAHRLTGLGFDEDQQVLVISLMQQAQLAGVAWTLTRYADRDITPIDMLGLILLGASEISPESLNRCMQQALRYHAQPMSAEVAAEMRRSNG
jgi:hypothetical protein